MGKRSVAIKLPILAQSMDITPFGAEKPAADAHAKTLQMEKDNPRFAGNNRCTRAISAKRRSMTYPPQRQFMPAVFLGIDETLCPMLYFSQTIEEFWPTMDVGISKLFKFESCKI